MTSHDGLDPMRHSRRNEFFSDANLNLRSRPATYSDYAPIRESDTDHALKNSHSLRMHQAMGRSIVPLSLAENEVDGEPVEAPEQEFDRRESPWIPDVSRETPGELSDKQMDDLASRIAAKLQGNQ